MKKKEEIRQLNKLLKSIKNFLTTYFADGQQEDLHQFRIQVKKLKAMLTLYRCEPNNKSLLQDFKPIKEVFKKAGEIRNAHINLKLGEKHQINNKNFNDLQHQILNESSDKFKSKSSKYFKSIKKVQSILENNIHHLQNKIIRKFYKDKLEKIDAFFIKPTFNEDLHNARKNIKLLLYNQETAAAAIQNKIQLNQAYLDKLQNIIGKWHDHNLVIDVLSNNGKAEDAAIQNIKKVMQV